MNDAATVVFGLFLFGLLIGVFLLTVKLIFEVYQFLFKRNESLSVVSRVIGLHDQLSSVQIKILQKHYPFYQKLPLTSKKTFENRVARFIAMKHFIGEDGMVITDQVKALIAAAAIQVSFGLRDFRYLHFDTIYIFPEKFYSKFGKAYHLGETNPRMRSISFSWYDFLKGIAIEDDNLNLGLHEFSHALFLNYVAGKKEDWHFDAHYETWKSEGSQQFFALRESGQDYIRDYATTNLMEFFAVCVECFFETPRLLNEKHPDIYASIRKLLKQNPIALQ